jgi:inhibitor of KinA
LSEYILKFKPFGSHSILIEWPQEIDESIVLDVLRFKKTLRNFYIKEKVEIKSAYCSLLISYDHAINNIYNKYSQLKRLYSLNEDLDVSSFKTWKIPVCYDLKFGLDLEEFSNAVHLSIDDIIRYHTNRVYTVFFIGFLPGFLYLGNLDERIHFPRKQKPRLKVQPGDVGIGEQQTGIYPIESPGGWNVIGNSPIDFFSVNKPNPCFAKAGDKIQFCPISTAEYDLIKIQMEMGQYQIESEVLND